MLCKVLHFISLLRVQRIVLNDMAPASKILAAKRLREKNSKGIAYKDEYYISSKFPDKLFCIACEKTIDHSRPSSLDNHLEGAKHLAAKRLKEKKNLQGRRQLTLNDTNTSAELRTEITQDFIAVCCEADIPMNKASKLVPMFRKHARNGGAIPKNESTLRKHHLPRVYQQHIAEVRRKLEGKKVFVALDETLDERDNSVLNVLVGK